MLVGTLFLASFVAATDRLIAFGDSMTFSGGTWSRFSEAYNDPSWRFTEGDVWVERLSKMHPRRNLTNFAYGGASVHNTTGRGLSGLFGNISAPSVNEQIEAFRSQGFVKPWDRVYQVLWAGGIDFFKNTSVTGESVVDLMVLNLDALETKRSQTLVLNQMPLQVLPACSGDAELQQKSHNFSIEFNLHLEQRLKGRRNVHIVDMHRFISELVANATHYGFRNVIEPCFKFDGPSYKQNYMGQCEHPDEHLFWDPWHFNSRGHFLIASYIAQHHFHAQ